MGTYLATGIIQSIWIRKKDISENIDRASIEESLQKEVNLDCYTYKKEMDTVGWEIQPEMFEGNFVQFLEKQFHLYYGDSNYLTIIPEEVKKASTGQELLELAERKEHFQFQLIEQIFDNIKVKKDNGFTTNIVVYYHMIAFFLDGKISMECYSKILHYFEKNIKLQNKEYPIVECLKVMITG